jgi:subtilisin-like proprotein convertase family protein
LPRPAHSLPALAISSVLLTGLLASTSSPAVSATAATTFHQTAPISLGYDGDGETSAANNTDTVLADGPAAPSTITLIAPADATLTDVYVDVSVTHENLADLDLMLVAPSGEAVTLMSDIGGGAFDGLIRLHPQWKWPLTDDASSCGNSTCYGLPRDVDTDAGDADVYPATAPDSAPSSYSALGGASVAGDWTLYAVDDATGNAGVIDAWAAYAWYGLPAFPSPSTLDVAGMQRSITDVDLCLEDLDLHTLSSVDVVLESPGGRRAHVLGNALQTLLDPSGAKVPGLQVCLDDEADLDVPPVAFPSAASYRPNTYNGARHHEYVAGFDAAALAKALSVFDGADPNGTWKLWVHSANAARAWGEIGGWSLRITSTTPATATPAPPPATSTSPPPAPKVLAFRPKNAQGGVRLSVSPRIVFSTDLMTASVTATSVNLRTVYGRKVRVSLTYDAATRTVIVDPRHHLEGRTRYTLTVKTGLRDTAGTRLARVRTATFRTR